MSLWWGNLIGPVIKRRAWIQHVLVTAVAASLAWLVGNEFVTNGGLVAAIAATLTVRISLNKSIGEGLGQLLGTTIGVGMAMIAIHFFGFGVTIVFVIVVLSLVFSRVLHLREVASINVVITALIVIGPGLAESTAIHRTLSTLIGTSIAIVFSYFANPKTPAGRTIDRITELAFQSAELLGEMSEEIAIEYSQDIAGSFLARARLLVEEIPSVRAQALEARSYAQWFPTARKDEAEDLYERGFALEHTVVQVRTIARTLFDMSIERDLPPKVTESIAYALSCASLAITQGSEALKGNNRRLPEVSITRDLRVASASLAEEVMECGRKIKVAQYIRSISLVTNFERIANSIDLDTPAITEIRPEEDLGIQLLEVSPIEQGRRLGGKFLRFVPGQIKKRSGSGKGNLET